MFSAAGVSGSFKPMLDIQLQNPMLGRWVAVAGFKTQLLHAILGARFRERAP